MDQPFCLMSNNLELLHRRHKTGCQGSCGGVWGGGGVLRCTGVESFRHGRLYKMFSLTRSCSGPQDYHILASAARSSLQTPDEMQPEQPGLSEAVDTPGQRESVSVSCGLEAKGKARGWLTEEERVSGRRGGIIIQWEGEGVSVGAEHRLTVHYL